MRADYHLHTDHLGCADETMRVSDIVSRCEELGFDEIAITDHLNERGEAVLHRRIKGELLELDTDLRLYFGAELNFDRPNGEFAADEGLKEEVGFQFFIGGIHSAYGTDRPPLDILRTQHLHHLKTCRDELVDVLVHPYWFYKGELREMPCLEDLRLLPGEWVDELGEVAAETGTAIELNAMAIFCNHHYPDSFQESYMEFLARLRDGGAMFSVSTDAHSLEQLEWIKESERMVSELGIPEERLWRPGVSDIREAADRD